MQTQCKLGSYTYPYNPPDDKNPRIKLVSLTDTMVGRIVTDWGTSASRQDIEQSWDTMDAEFFSELDTRAVQGGTLTFVDQFNVSYTVVAIPPTYDRIVPGGEAYINVKFKLHVLSKP